MPRPQTSRPATARRRPGRQSRTAAKPSGAHGDRAVEQPVDGEAQRQPAADDPAEEHPGDERGDAADAPRRRRGRSRLRRMSAAHSVRQNSTAMPAVTTAQPIQ